MAFSFKNWFGMMRHALSGMTMYVKQVLGSAAEVFVDEWTCIACRNCCDVAPRTFCIDADAGRARVFAQWGNGEELLDYAALGHQQRNRFTVVRCRPARWIASIG